MAESKQEIQEEDKNLLPENGKGRLTYRENFLTPDESQALLNLLIKKKKMFKSEVVIGRGKTFIIKTRRTAFFNRGTGSNNAYAYSGAKRAGNLFGVGKVGRALEDIRRRVSTEFAFEFDTCILTRYLPKGQLGWHKDSEKDLNRDAPIVGISLGQERAFCAKPNDGAHPTVKLTPKQGSVFVMHSPMQSHFKHTVPARANLAGDRYSLTFRVLKK